MKWIKLFLITIIIVSGCSTNEIVRIKVNYAIPIIHSDERVEDFSTTFFKTVKGDYIFYELPISQIINSDNSVSLDATRYQFFVFKNGEENGVLLDSTLDSNPKILGVDSTLNARAMKSFDASELLKYTVNGCKTIDIDKSIFRKSYRFDSGIYDSVHYWFDRDIVKIPHSFSHIQDSLNNAKLFKIELFLVKDTGYNAEYLNQHRAMKLELTSHKSMSKKTITNIIRMYETFINKP